MVDQIFGHLSQKGVVVYIDDIVICTKNIDDHVALIEEVMEKVGLCIKCSKSKLCENQITYLGLLSCCTIA